MKVLKKPVIVEAWQVDIKELDSYEAPNWVIDEYTGRWGRLFKGNKISMVISTLEGNMKASIGDYIIKGVEGELYPVRKDIFEKTYEVVE